MTSEAITSQVSPNRIESREIAAIYNLTVSSSENAKHIELYCDIPFIKINNIVHVLLIFTISNEIVLFKFKAHLLFSNWKFLKKEEINTIC